MGSNKVIADKNLLLPNGCTLRRLKWINLGGGSGEQVGNEYKICNFNDYLALSEGELYVLRFIITEI